MNLRLVLSSVLVFSLLGAGCGKGDGDGAESGESGMAHTCDISVIVKGAAKKEGPTYEGKASGEDEKAVEEEAWKKACDAVPEAERADCRNNDVFRYSSAGGSASAGGPKTYSRTITLTKKLPPPKEFAGSATSNESADAACAEAMSKACKEAGTEGDCVKAGSHDQRSKRSSSKR